jgi:LCP family protein required for cell wall assembly
MQRAAPWIAGIVAIVVIAIVAFLLLSNRAGEVAASPSEPALSATPNPSATLNAEMLEQRWTVLFVGTDANAAREEQGQPVNADAIMVASVSADQSELALISLPRDTVDLPLPDGSTYPQKVNALYTEQGIDGVSGAIEELYGVPIEAHVALDMDDMEALIAAVDGVDVNPPAPLVDPIVNLDLQAGPQELDAPTAMGYVRTRVDQDYGRMGRQQEVILSLVERLANPETDLDFQALVDGLESLETDLPLEELPTLLELGRLAGDAAVTNLVIQPPLIVFEGDRGDGRGYILEPDVEAIRAEVQGLIGDE